MAYTFSDLQAETKRRATRNESGTEYDTAIKNIINTSLFRIAREALWRTLRRATTVTIGASAEETVLPPQIGDRFFLWHEDYGYPYVLEYVPEQKFLSMHIDKDTTGTITHYRTWTTDMTKAQPTSSSALTISSSASGDTNIDVTAFGIVSSYPDYETITTDASDGTTGVDGSKSFTSVDRIVKGSSSTGRITVTSNSAAVTVAVLPVGDTTAGIMYRKIKVYPLDSAGTTLNCYYYKDLYRLVNDGDVHELGQDFDEAIILLSTSKINYENNKDEGTSFFSLYRDELKSLKRTNIDKIDWFPGLERPTGSRNRPMVHPYLSYQQVSGYAGPRVY